MVEVERNLPQPTVPKPLQEGEGIIRGANDQGTANGRIAQLTNRWDCWQADHHGRRLGTIVAPVKLEGPVYAFLCLVPRLLPRFCQMDPQRPRRYLHRAGFVPALAQRRLILLRIPGSGPGQRVVASRRSPRHALWPHRRNSYWRIGFLYRLRRHLHILEAVEAALMVEGIFGEAALDDIQAFVHALPLPFQWHPVGLVLVVGAASNTHTPIKSAAGNQVEGSDIFGHAQRMIQWENQDECPDPDMRSARGNGRQHRELRGRPRVDFKVVFSVPDVSESQLLGIHRFVNKIMVDLLQGFRVIRVIAYRHGESNIHDVPLLSFRKVFATLVVALRKTCSRHAS